MEEHKAGHTMKVLVACEFSGIVRNEFAKRGHDAWSVDLEPTEIPGNHIQGDMFDYVDKDWDMLIAFPPCTYIARSGFRWHYGSLEFIRGLNFVIHILNLNIPKLALENPVGAINSWVSKPDQIIHPWQFGHGEVKSTCLWLKGLPLLQPTNVVPGRTPRVHYESPGPDRAKNRSRTYVGIAEAMADQWGTL
jgi:hypothetical protein